MVQGDSVFLPVPADSPVNSPGSYSQEPDSMRDDHPPYPILCSRLRSGTMNGAIQEVMDSEQVFTWGGGGAQRRHLKTDPKMTTKHQPDGDLGEKPPGAGHGERIRPGGKNGHISPSRAMAKVLQSSAP